MVSNHFSETIGNTSEILNLKMKNTLNQKFEIVSG